jgi:hypothetical protein
MPQMGYDTKTDRLTDWLSVAMWLWLWLWLAIDTDHSNQYWTSFDQLLLVTSPTATTSTRQQQGYGPATAGRKGARLLAETAWALPAGANLRSASWLQPRLHSTSNDMSQSAAAKFNMQAPRTTCPPQRTGNSTQISSADYPLAARWTQPVAVRAAREICRTHYGPFQGHHPPTPTVPVSCLVLRSGGADRHKDAQWPYHGRT